METKVSNTNLCAFLFLILPVVILMSGCVSAEQYAGAAEQAAKDAKNLEAGILEDAPCLIGLGAWGRMDDLRRRKSILLLCVSDAEQFGVKLQ